MNRILEFGQISPFAAQYSLCVVKSRESMVHNNRGEYDDVLDTVTGPRVNAGTVQVLDDASLDK